jgi:4-amino-4-deoxychorismate lyase
MRIGANEALAGLKTLNRLESVLARAEWTDERVWEGLLRDGDDNFVCGTMSNLFLMRGSLLTTPLLDRCGVAGVMRRWVIANAHRVGLQVRERRVRWSDLKSAEEAFMTNAVAGVVSLTSVTNGRLRASFAEMRTARAMQSLLEKL